MKGALRKNFDTLIPLLNEFPDRIMFCSDDKHPDMLIEGHINQLVAKALELGFSPVQVLRAATLNPVIHYGLNVGLLRVGDPADFIVTRSIDDFRPTATYIDGVRVAENGKSLLEHTKSLTINRFHCRPVNCEDIRVHAKSDRIRVIRAIDGHLITEEMFKKPTIQHGQAVSDPEKDLLKLVVVNRYTPAPPAVAFVTGFNMKRGAAGSSVAHDSHNIIAVGVEDNDIAAAINAIISSKGGLSFNCGTSSTIMPLSIAGLMSDKDGYAVTNDYKGLDRLVKQAGSTLTAPYMTLSFLALLVIPELKLSDKGLFNGKTFSFVDLFM